MRQTDHFFGFRSVGAGLFVFDGVMELAPSGDGVIPPALSRSRRDRRRSRSGRVRDFLRRTPDSGSVGDASDVVDFLKLSDRRRTRELLSSAANGVKPGKDTVGIWSRSVGGMTLPGAMVDG